MSTLSINRNQFPVNLETYRSVNAIELESVNHYLTIFFCSHPDLQDEVREYKAAQRYLETIAGDDIEVDTQLKLTLAKDYYRACFGHSWDLRK